MPPKQRITREMILERSFEMFCREGMSVVNARSVAKALNCSTQPIFSYFSGMDDLKNALEEKARTLLTQAVEVQEQEGAPIVNVGCAYARFAAEQPYLFAHLTAHENPIDLFVGPDKRDGLIEREAAYANLTQEQAKKLGEQMFLYIHGVAAMCASRHAPYTFSEQERMIRDAHEMALAFIRSK